MLRNMRITLKPKLRRDLSGQTIGPTFKGQESRKKAFRMSGRDVVLPLHRRVLCVTSGFRREADENCARLGY